MTKPDPTDPNYLHWCRRQSVAAGYKPALASKMRKLLDDDPEARAAFLPQGLQRRRAAHT